MCLKGAQGSQLAFLVPIPGVQTVFPTFQWRFLSLVFVTLPLISLPLWANVASAPHLFFHPLPSLNRGLGPGPGQWRSQDRSSSPQACSGSQRTRMGEGAAIERLLCTRNGTRESSKSVCGVVVACLLSQILHSYGYEWRSNRARRLI